MPAGGRRAERQTGREVHEAREFVLTRATAARCYPERETEPAEALGGTEVEAGTPTAERLGGFF